MTQQGKILAVVDYRFHAGARQREPDFSAGKLEGSSVEERELLDRVMQKRERMLTHMLTAYASRMRCNPCGGQVVAGPGSKFNLVRGP